MDISEDIKKKLKRPLGELHRDFREIKKLEKDYRIISVGDVCTLGLLAMGIRPHLAVYDYKFMRKPLGPEGIAILERYFKNPRKFRNPAGTISEKLLKSAPALIESGGGILIDGEDDLVALALIIDATEKDIIVYGQPNEGLVVVKPKKEIKKKIEKWLTSMSL